MSVKQKDISCDVKPTEPPKQKETKDQEPNFKAYFSKALGETLARLKRYEKDAVVKLPSWMKRDSQVMKYLNFDDVVDPLDSDFADLEYDGDVLDLPESRMN